jgi:hypothetical protein
MPRLPLADGGRFAGSLPPRFRTAATFVFLHFHIIDARSHDLLRWPRKIGQEVKFGLLLRRTDLNDGQTEAVFGGFQGEGCS